MRDLDRRIWSPKLVTTAEEASRHFVTDLSSRSPNLSKHVYEWLALRLNLNRPEDYFLRPRSLPILSFPWWLEASIHSEIDVCFQSRLMFSTVNGYFFSRMVDDLMDGHTTKISAIPALYSFYTQFHSSLMTYFESSNPFWQDFAENIYISADATAADSSLASISQVDFIEISARKTAAGMIPLAAVCHQYRRLDLFESWRSFYSLFGRWHQMYDDLSDWNQDHKAGNSTWLLSMAEKSRGSYDSVASWIGREGLNWAADVMGEWMNEMANIARSLNCPELILYLEQRQKSFSARIAALTGIAKACLPLVKSDVVNHFDPSVGRL